MPLGTEVDLGPGHIVLDGIPALRKTGTAAPPHLFGLCLLWAHSPISATAELLFWYSHSKYVFVSEPNDDKITGQIIFSNCVLSD